jgi:hypothetical protein
MTAQTTQSTQLPPLGSSPYVATPEALSRFLNAAYDIRDMAQGVAGVYAIDEPVGLSSYVGCGADIGVRLAAHLRYGGQSRHGRERRAWLDRLIASGAKPIARVLEQCSANREALLEREAYWIDVYGLSRDLRYQLRGTKDDTSAAQIRRLRAENAMLRAEVARLRALTTA